MEIVFTSKPTYLELSVTFEDSIKLSGMKKPAKDLWASN